MTSAFSHQEEFLHARGTEHAWALFWEQGTGKIGNATPVYGAGTRTLYLFHIAGPKPHYDIWLMER